MHHQRFDDQRRTVAARLTHVCTATLQPTLQPQPLKQGLKDHQTGEGGHLLILKTKCWQRAASVVNRLASEFHGS
jgi:hypothetical protein